MTLEILDAGGSTVRRYSRADQPFEPQAERATCPHYWIRPPQPLSAKAGFHRFVWDLHYDPPRVAQFRYPIAAIQLNTPRVPHGPWAPPGNYTVRLTVDGQAQTKPLVVKMDPRVKTPAAGLDRQFALSKQLYDAITAVDESDSRRRAQLLQLYGIVQGADAAPTAQAEAAVKALLSSSGAR